MDVCANLLTTVIFHCVIAKIASSETDRSNIFCKYYKTELICGQYLPSV